MRVANGYPDGIISWVDLSTPDVAGAKAFYSALFGWEHQDMPTNMGMAYTTFMIDGKRVAGMGPLPPDQQAQGVPAHWSTYVNHSDVDTVAANVAAAGGVALFPPVDVMEAGRMGLFQDPTGASFGVWQPRNNTGAELTDIPSTLVWSLIYTRDSVAAANFYSTVFGWTANPEQTGYMTFSQNGQSQAGLMQMDDSWGAVPPTWVVYFMVSDVAQAVARIEELGGAIVMPPTPAGDMGRFSFARDPQGAVFVVMDFSGPVTPRPSL